MNKNTILATDREDFMTLLQPILPNIERFARSLTRDEHEAKELVCETIAVAFERFDRLRHPEALLSFCFTVATRLYRKRARKTSAFEPLDERSAEFACDSAHEPDTNADVGILYQALDKLPEKQREAVIMFEIMGFSIKEIQTVQGGTSISVKVRLSRARAALRRMLLDRAPASESSSPRLIFQDCSS